MTCLSLRDVRYSVLELFSKMYHWKLHDSLVGSDHVGTPLKKINMAHDRSLFWLCRNFSSLLNCTYPHFSLHTGCSDLKNTRWIDVFMYVICFSAVAASIRLCHGLWKRCEIQTASFSKQSGLPSWKHASRYILKCFFYSMKIKLQKLAGVTVWK